jgi:hypothetical protein
MRKHILIFIHGMGVYVDENGNSENSWGIGALDVLKAQYEKYPSLVTSFDDVFEPVTINYDFIFNNILRRWATEANAITNTGIDAAEIALRMVHWLNDGAQTDDNFAWTHVGDVILYRFFNLVRQRVKISVAKQIHDALEPNQDGAVTRWSIIAHSLGTAVTHDVVHAMSSTTPNDAGIPILDAMVPKANLIAMIANVSKTLENDAMVYTSAVVPPVSCDVYLNANNKYDPFVMEKLMIPEQFNPFGNPLWDTALAQKKYVNIEPENIHELNVHSIKNYLVNPRVHIPVLRALCGPGSIPKNLAEKAYNEFENFPVPELKESLIQTISKFEDKSWYDGIATLLPMLEAEND